MTSRMIVLNPTLKRHAIAIATALSATSALGVRPAAAQVCASFPTQLCNFATSSIANNSFIVENNPYNDPGQCIQMKTDGSFCLSIAPPTIGFPNILQGTVFGNGPTAGWSPLQVSSISKNWPITWTVGRKPTPPGNWQTFLDFWMTTTNHGTATVGQPDGAEIVVWITSSTGSTPDGLNVLDHAFVGGIAWDFYAGRRSNNGTGWNHVVYVPRVGFNGINIDFSPFFTNAQLQTGAGTNAPMGPCQDAASNVVPCVDGNWYVTSVQAGFQANGGGVGLTSSNFTSHPNTAQTTPPCDSLQTGMTVFSSHALDSCDGKYELVLQPDDNLVIHDSSLQPLWASGTLGITGGVTTLLMQADGNLVLRDGSNNPLWATGTAGPSSGSATLGFGNLVVNANGKTWSAGGGLTSGAELLSGGFTMSGDRRFKLAVQGGNLVLTFGSQVLWTRGNGTGAYVVMQGEDGNLVLYDVGHNPVWASNTTSAPGAFLEMSNDGNLTIFSRTRKSVLWQSGTGGH